MRRRHGAGTKIQCKAHNWRVLGAAEIRRKRKVAKSEKRKVGTEEEEEEI